MSDLSLSVIVPVYNEQDMLEGCLRSLLDQTDPIDDIVIVDNNSTDSTATVAAAFAKKFNNIRVICAPDPGVINARSAGFDAAAGRILARVDADTRVGPSWAKAVRRYFATYGDTFAAGTGMCSCHDLPWQDSFRRQQRRITVAVASALGKGDLSAATAARLFGSNMALRRDAWESVREQRSARTDIFEDLDLTLTLNAAGHRIGLIPGADAQISGRRFLSPPWDYLRYCWRDQRTLRNRGQMADARRAVVTTLSVQLPFYVVMWIPFRAFNPATRRMQASRLLRRRTYRALPGGNAR